MTKSKYKTGDRSFKKLTGDEKAIVVGQVTKTVCIDLISEIADMPRIDAINLLQTKIINHLKSKSPKKIEHILSEVRKIKY